MKKVTIQFGCFGAWLLGLLLILSASSPTPTPIPQGGGWLRLQRWDEGLAQICLYEGRQLKYGNLVPSSLEMITIRETMDQLRLVKAADASAAWPVMKMNLTRRTRTGVYEYVQMASVFVHRDTGRLVKLATTSSEWCGTSFTQLECPEGKAELLISNYFPSGGTRREQLDPDALPVFYDQLPLFLKQRLDSLEAGEAFQLAAPLLSHKPSYSVAPAQVLEVETGTETLADGSAVDVRRVKLRTETGDETFAFAETPLRSLVYWENEAGEHYRLRKEMFLDYWNRNQPGDEALLD